MAMNNVTDALRFTLVRHNDHESAEKVLKEWTTNKRNDMLSRLDTLESCVAQNNYQGYCMALRQLKQEIIQLKETHDRVHDMLLFEDEMPNKDM